MTLVAECPQVIFMFNLHVGLEVQGTHGQGHVRIEDVELEIHISVVHLCVFIERSYAHVSVGDLENTRGSVVTDLWCRLGVDSIEDTVGEPAPIEMEVQLAEVLIGVDAVYL